MFRSAMTPYELARAAILSGSHCVSPRGVVYSFLANDYGAPVPLAWQFPKRGRSRAPYVVSRLPGSRQRIALKVHLLIAAQYLGPRPAGQVLRHLDDDRNNARLRNLAWGTQSQNRADRERNAKRRALAASPPAGPTALDDRPTASLRVV